MFRNGFHVSRPNVMRRRERCVLSCGSYSTGYAGSLSGPAPSQWRALQVPRASSASSFSTCHQPKNVAPFDWRCTVTWRRTAINTSWCLLGCSIGEFGTLGAFQLLEVTNWTLVCVLPIVNGLITSMALETTILMRGELRLPWRAALKTAWGMSFISMVAMEAAMELTDYALTGTMQLQLWAVPFMLLSGFLVPLPFNYWRLKRFGKSCH